MTPSRSSPKRTATDLIVSQTAKIQAILPSHMSANRIVRMATIEVARNPDLQKCEPTSIVLAVMDAARLGLDIGRQCNLIPYKNKAQMQPNYQGLCDLAYRTNRIGKITTAVVHEGDEFHVELGTSGHIVHLPKYDKQGEITHAYAAAQLENGAWEMEVMKLEELEHVRTMSRSPNSPAWKNFPGEMYRKVVLKRLLKRLPSSPELYEAIRMDHAVEQGQQDDPELEELKREGREIAFAEAGEEPPVWGSDAFDLEEEKDG